MAYSEIPRRSRFLLFLFLWIAACPLTSSAQTDAVSFGPHVSYTFGTPLNIERQVVNTLGSNGLGTSYAHTFGGGVELRFPSLVSRNIGLSLIGGYAWSIGEFTSNVFASSNNSLFAPGTQQFHLSSRYGTASVTILPAYRLAKNWDVGLGAQFSYRVQDNITEWREILSPAGAGFSNGYTIDTIPAGSSISSNPFRIAIPVFLGYSVPIGNGITLTSRLIGAADLNEMFAGYAAESFSAGISFSLLFGQGTVPLHRDVPRTPTRRDVLRTSPSPPPGRARHVPTIPAQNMIPLPNTIHASVHLEINGVSARTAHVREVDTLIETFSATPLDVRIPNAVSRLVRSYIVPDLSVSRYVESEAPVRGWRVCISQAGRTLAVYSNLDSTQAGAMSAAVELGGEHSSRAAPILAEMTVTDARGATRVAWDTLELTKDTSHAISRIHRQDYYFLEPKNSDLRNQDSLLLRNLISSLDTSGVLTISPAAPQAQPCSGRDSLSSTLLSALRASRVRPRIIELVNVPARAPTREASDGCGIFVRYERSEH